MNKKYIDELIANNDIDTISYITQVKNKQREIQELTKKRDEILEQLHSLFTKYVIGLKTFGADFNPIEDGIIESFNDEWILSDAEYTYRYHPHDDYDYDKQILHEECDLQWYSSKYTGHMRPFNIMSCVALREYMCYYGGDHMNDVIKRASKLFRDNGSFALGVCIVNDLPYTIPEDVWPETITSDRFERWFEKDHPNVTPEMKRKLFKRISS